MWWIDAAVACYAFVLSAILGIPQYVLIQLIVTMVSSAAGVWLFYVQHQFEDVYWERGNDWDYTAAALKPMTLLGSLKSLKLRLWDENAKRLISFRRARLFRAKKGA